jgi:hypothetical protein
VLRNRPARGGVADQQPYVAGVASRPRRRMLEWTLQQREEPPPVGRDRQRLEAAVVTPVGVGRRQVVEHPRVGGDEPRTAGHVPFTHSAVVADPQQRRPILLAGPEAVVARHEPFSVDAIRTGRKRGTAICLEHRLVGAHTVGSAVGGCPRLADQGHDPRRVNFNAAGGEVDRDKHDRRNEGGLQQRPP